METLRVKHESGFKIINADDFDPEIHTLYEESEETSLDDLNKAELEALAEKYEVEVEGTGSGGRPTKADYVRDLSEAGV